MMSSNPESIKDLVKRREELLKKRQSVLARQTQPGTSFSNDTDIVPKPSTSGANQTVLLESITTTTCEETIKPDFSDFSSDDSVADPDFVLTIDELVGNIRSPTLQSPVMESSLLHLEDIENFPERTIEEEHTSTRKRKAIADKDSWKRENNKRQRMMGKEYLGFRKIDGKYVQDIAKPNRKLNMMRCSSERCTSSKVFCCNIFTEEMRMKIFDEFWAMTWKEKKLYVLTLIDTQDTQRKTKGAGSNSRRSGSKIYHLKAANSKVRVCQTMFLGTLGIKEWTCRYWLGEKGSRGSSQEVSAQADGQNDQITKKLSVLSFLQEIPKLPSHYCRKSSQKLYLEPIIQSKAHLYRLYVKRANSLSSPVAGRKFFADLLSQQNISLFKPKKDECDTCCAHKAGNLSDEEHKIHLALKTAARQEKNKDKEAAIKGEVHAITADMQAVMLCPYLNASALYFKTKLCVHNFTVYNLSNHQAMCYWFDETVTDLRATTYASFFVAYITNLLENDPKEVIIYTDGCTAQNRNNVVSNALLRLAVKYNVTITQKFLEKGHTQMEVDSVHSVIERKLKNREIHLPSQYAMISKEARIKPFPYDVVMPDYTFFKDYSRKDYLVYESIRPGRVAGDKCVTNIRVLRYNTNSTIDYKLMYSDEYMRLPRRAKPIESLLSEPPQLHDGPQKITKAKFNHLQELKTVIPPDCHEFYNNLIFDD
ncbi:uncharacterized protein LOC123689220 [Pieris rapae]|uniref:uncharacterized protein LOC123689220 n=1 Tax=Pieris rapae TaxID=64459 RepID=UPI001E28069C|nr:uncharacterized protein LOC123689220 [Pieris rapae]